MLSVIMDKMTTTHDETLHEQKFEFRCGLPHHLPFAELMQRYFGPSSPTPYFSALETILESASRVLDRELNKLESGVSKVGLAPCGFNRSIATISTGVSLFFGSHVVRADVHWQVLAQIRKSTMSADLEKLRGAKNDVMYAAIFQSPLEKAAFLFAALFHLSHRCFSAPCKRRSTA